MLRELGLGAESTLIDLGTGTALALAAAPMCRRVVASTSPAMLAYVNAKATEQRGKPELVQAGS